MLNIKVVIEPRIFRSSSGVIGFLVSTHFVYYVLKMDTLTGKPIESLKKQPIWFRNNTLSILYIYFVFENYAF
jgi:hypothetical protein